MASAACPVIEAAEAAEIVPNDSAIATATLTNFIPASSWAPTCHAHLLPGAEYPGFADPIVKPPRQSSPYASPNLLRQQAYGRILAARRKGRQQQYFQGNPGNKMTTATRIDCDIHPAVGGTRTTLLPYLSDHWKEQVVSRAIDGLDLNSYPPSMPP